jgi:hypothetical protein
MELGKVFGIAAIVLLLIGPYQLYRFKKEFLKLNQVQIIPDEFVGKWDKRLTLMVVLSFLGLAFGLAAIFLL